MRWLYSIMLRSWKRDMVMSFKAHHYGYKSVGLALDGLMALYFTAPSEMGITIQTLLIPTDSPMQVLLVVVYF